MMLKFNEIENGTIRSMKEKLEEDYSGMPYVAEGKILVHKLTIKASDDKNDFASTKKTHTNKVTWVYDMNSSISKILYVRTYAKWEVNGEENLWIIQEEDILMSTTIGEE